MTWRERLLRFLRVPSAPHPPAGDENVRIFRASPRYFLYRVVQWCARNLAAAIGLLLALGFASNAAIVLPDRIPLHGRLFEWLGISYLTEGTILMLLGLIEAGAIIAFIAQAVGSLILLRLDFEQRWYLVSDRSLRTREGLVRLHEKTMTFANIQNLSIRQGPIQRLLGIADLQIRTAGGGGNTGDDIEGKSQDLHVAYCRGIGNAAEVREVIRERLQRHRDAGLGDPDDAAHAAHDPPLLTAARSLTEEARRLRLAFMSQDA
jgi:membrane protein YdbS with pleckstrin-like domain